MPAVRKFAQQMEHLELAVREATTGHIGMLTIGAIASAMVEVLPPFLERLRKAYPQLTISVREIDSVDAVPALRAGDVDLAFARLQGDLGADFETLTLAQDRLAVALPAGHRLVDRSRIRLDELAEEPFVMFARNVSPGYFDSIIAVCRGAGFSPRILHEVRSVATQVAFVGCGQGIALVPAALKRVSPDGVVFKALTRSVDVVTTAAAWSVTATNPAVALAVETLRERTLVARS